MDGKARPPATPAEALAAMDRLIATSLVAQHAIAQRLGLNVTDLTCVGHILGAVDAPLTAGELAVRAGVTTGAITGVVNRLESAGFVERRPDPADRRRVRIVAQDTASRRIHEVYEPFYDRLADVFADYSPDEIAVLGDWLTRAGGLMTTYLAELRERGDA
ncbi:putative HTH-type transcriptional regulator YcgE [Streptomyces camponoticapitis]|uniref:HTH-type transcriptional regulator YcgE n=1 Tax=Streptomyces camponoticapitis TaxID=1616125 RepID=A0ABQ2E952_9ACTN|nr:MarR family transcriptional regulator [Streptomyces camponoticapitis]GGK00969.1 putative HTH-type transcriptional regulator YcgE [Streptomyces camponoticapitis]